MDYQMHVKWGNKYTEYEVKSTTYYHLLTVKLFWCNSTVVLHTIPVNL